MSEDQFDLFMMLVAKMIAVYHLKLTEPANKTKIEVMMRDLVEEHDRVKQAVVHNDWEHMV